MPVRCGGSGGGPGPGLGELLALSSVISCLGSVAAQNHTVHVLLFSSEPQHNRARPGPGPGPSPGPGHRQREDQRGFVWWAEITDTEQEVMRQQKQILFCG